MSQKYWCKIDDGVEGPYEPQALRFLDGFSPDILVSPDNDADETWTRVSDVAELQALLNLTPKPGPAPLMIDAAPPITESPSRPGETLEEEWGIETTQELPRLLPAEPTPEPAAQPKEEFVTTTDMLDLMEKISQEMKQKTPAPQPIAVPAAIPKAVRIYKPRRDFRRPALIAASLLIAAGLTFWEVKTHKPKKWWKAIATKFHKKEAPVQEIPTLPAPAIEVKQEPINPMHAPIMARRKPKVKVKPAEPMMAARPEPVPPSPVAEPAPKKTPEQEKELATQKFYLPGVPSPKLSSSHIDADQPLPESPDKNMGSKEALPLIPPTKDEARPKKSKKSESKKDSDKKTNWENEASWGN